LKETSKHYLDSFIRETCRAELTHWIVFLFGPLFLMWNLWWVGIIMIVYATLANIPCVITQRYNRIRLQRIAR
jgi:glycosyl-4,4'-diaponeurosporenoate acyltransferase